MPTRTQFGTNSRNGSARVNIHLPVVVIVMVDVKPAPSAGSVALMTMVWLPEAPVIDTKNGNCPPANRINASITRDQQTMDEGMQQRHQNSHPSVTD